MSSGKLILDRGISETEARQKIASQDRASWFPAKHSNGSFGIVAKKDGREVAGCARFADRDFLLRAAKAHDELVSALKMARAVYDSVISTQIRTAQEYAKSSDVPQTWIDLVESLESGRRDVFAKIDAALAQAEKP